MNKRKVNGMACPRCGETSLITNDTRPRMLHGHHVISRAHPCSVCGKNFRTLEIDANTLDTILSQNKRMNDLLRDVASQTRAIRS